LLMNVPSAVDGAVKVTEAPPNGEPFELTKTENVPNGFPTGCGVMYPPDCAAIAMVAVGGIEELPQPTKKAAVVKARIEAIAMAILEWIFRFKATLLSAQPSRWLDHGIAAKTDAVLVSDMYAWPRALAALLLLRHFLLGLTLQSTADSRVRVRLNGKQFLPAVHNHEAEVHFGSTLRRYGGRAPAVRVDPVVTGDGLVCERENRAILATGNVSAYDSVSRRVDTELQLTDESHRSCDWRSCEEHAGCFKPKTTLNSGIGAGRGALLHAESRRGRAWPLEEEQKAC
jgi:hypothetical protein